MSYRPSPSRRPPVSQRTYLMRRLIAIVVVLSVGFFVYSVGLAVFGGNEQQRVESAPAEVNYVESDGSSPITASTTTTSLPPKEDFVPSAETPVTVYIAGDSDAGTFGPYLETLMDQTGMVVTQLDYKVSSGLSRPDFYDWPARFTEQLPIVNPDIIVVTFGGNDAQGLAVAGGEFIVGQPTGEVGGDLEWREEYGKRVGAVMDQLLENNRTVIWVGIPNDDNPEVTARMRVQDETVRAEAAKRPDVVFIDTWARFSGRNGGWAEYVGDPRDGIGKDVRADDGFHLNTVGAEILALDIAEAIRQDLRDRGANL